jgi:hypothetical protein
MRGDAATPPAAQNQYGVFTRSQARAAGVSAKRLGKLVDDERWVRVVGPVFAAQATVLTPVSMAYAATLAAGLGAIASHMTAAQVCGYVVPPDPEVHAIVGPDARPRIRGLRAHRVALAEPDVMQAHGVLVTAPVRTALDCILWLPEEAGRALVVDALRRGRLRVGELQHAVMESPRRHGLARAWSVLRDVLGDPHSEAEVLAHRLLRRAEIGGWEANAPLYDEEGLIGVVDLVFRGQRVVVEIDGWAFHSDRLSFQNDRRRRNRLVRAGYRVHQFTWDDLVRRPRDVVAQIVAALAG